MGFSFLISATANNSIDLQFETSRLSQTVFQIKTNTLSATMKETDQGYIVLKGSQSRKELSPSTTETYRSLRRKLLETRILVENGNDLIFAEDAVFNSPSAAANMVLGRNLNGYTEWITNSGKTFKEIQESLEE